MSGLLGLGVLVMIVADGVVGVRLLLLARRTRCVPELAFGCSLLLIGGLGYPLAIAARNGVGGPEGASTLLGAALAIQNLGAAAMAIANWNTFRQRDAWGRWLCFALIGLLVAGWVGQALGDGFTLAAGASAYYWVGFAGRSLPFAWSAAEAWSYHEKLRRRMAIGLADPVVADRIRLWAINATSVTSAFALFGIAAVMGVPVATSPWVLAVTSATGLLSGVSMWLAFVPPDWYLRRLAPTPAPA